MEKRKWLWKRKASDKSPGGTESSESISSHSEKNYDDQETQKTSPNYEIQSPEAASTTATSCEEESHNKVGNLTEKLSNVLVDDNAKDDLVKQHAKVAEEAVAGWEKAENEVYVIKQQLEASQRKNSVLEDRVSHLDGALKECVRQLSHAREEQEQKIHEWEATKSELQIQLLDLQSQLKSSSSIDPHLCQELDLLEKENSVLKNELYSQSKELELMIIERDLSIKAAESASKQHLKSIKKIAKLEAECRRLQAMARKSASVYMESFTDSQSDGSERLNTVEPSHGSDSWASALIAELDQFKNKKVEIDLMDDFLEMERLAQLSQTETKISCLESQVIDNESVIQENPMKAELEAMHHYTTELEEKLRKIKAEKTEFEIKFETFEEKKAELEEKIKYLESEKSNLENRLTDLEAMHRHANDLEEKLGKMEAEKTEFEVKFKNVEEEKSELEKYLKYLESEKANLEKRSKDFEAMHHHTNDLEGKLSKMVEIEAELEEKVKYMEQEKAGLEKNLIQIELEKKELENILKEMGGTKHEFEEKLNRMEAEREELVSKLTESQALIIASQARLKETELKLLDIENELQMSNEKKQCFESKVVGYEFEINTMSAKVVSLEAEIEKERALYAEIEINNQKLGDELSRMKQESELRESASSDGEFKIKKEDLVLAAGKLAECQETILSLGKQLKTLSSVEDFLNDPTNLTDFSEGGEGSLLTRASNGEIWRLHSNDTFLDNKRNLD